METCSILQRPLFAGSSLSNQPECLRHSGHSGEHLGRDDSGVYVIYWVDYSCSCERCASSEPIDWCEPFSHIDASKAEKLLASPSATLLDWGAAVVKLRE